MKYVPIVISLLALCLSVFTFYWVQLRIKHKLHLVRIDKVEEFDIPIFALVNSGTKDVLITSVVGWFKHSDAQGSTSPSQRVEIGEKSSMLLKASTAVQCRITFLEEFTKSFVTSGKLREGSTPDIYEFKFMVEIGWVDSQAHSHKARAEIAKYGFSEDRGIRMFSPLEAKHDLYKKS
ncbi:hypothetical protein [Marinobacterium aestuariivivens]|uniref:Uncharacterized protein n=1 Tax=Marinobacterium aestuariivivens TaxID=1698799 RepID=A0ABW2A191_9GAMM